MKKIISTFLITMFLFTAIAYAEDYQSLSRFIGKKVALHYYYYVPNGTGSDEYQRWVNVIIESTSKEYRESSWRTDYKVTYPEFLYYTVHANRSVCINIKQIISIEEL